jgi:hypothetical protein
VARVDNGELSAYQVADAVSRATRARNGIKGESMTTTITIPHPLIVSRDQWLTERKKLLAHDRAQLRVQEPGATNPGEYLIYRHESRDQISISAGKTSRASSAHG